MNSITENWKDIAGYEGLYQVSDFGRVRCLSKRKNRTIGDNGIRSLNYANGNYPRITLSSGKRKFRTFLVHRLVVEAFIGNIPNGMDVNHKDCNKKNNYVENLEIVTKQQNSIHAVKNGMLRVVGSDNPCAKLKESQIPEIRMMIEQGKTNVSIGKLFGVSDKLISLIKNKRIWNSV